MLDALFKPKSVAIVGASNNPFSIGHIVMQNLLDHNFKGPIYPINPRQETILGLRCHNSLLDIEDPVDLAGVEPLDAIAIVEQQHPLRHRVHQQSAEETVELRDETRSVLPVQLEHCGGVLRQGGGFVAAFSCDQQPRPVWMPVLRLPVCERPAMRRPA